MKVEEKLINHVKELEDLSGKGAVAFYLAFTFYFVYVLACSVFGNPANKLIVELVIMFEVYCVGKIRGLNMSKYKLTEKLPEDKIP